LSETNRKKYVERVKGDLAKARALAPEAYVAASVVMTTVTSAWDAEATAAIGYRGNGKTAALGTESAWQAQRLLYEDLRTLGQVAVIELGVGEAFSSRVATCLFVVRPVAQPRTRVE
jgi:hypothetical protein